MVSKGNDPQMAQLFRLVKYYNLPRLVHGPKWDSSAEPIFVKKIPAKNMQKIRAKWHFLAKPLSFWRGVVWFRGLLGRRFREPWYFVMNLSALSTKRKLTVWSPGFFSHGEGLWDRTSNHDSS